MIAILLGAILALLLLFMLFGIENGRLAFFIGTVWLIKIIFFLLAIALFIGGIALGVTQPGPEAKVFGVILAGIGSGILYAFWDKDDD